MNERKANRLINSKSPYLLQHAYNPVDWYEWGEEAFAAARAANKPIFLSIGYSTCHWCHVMEKQSFENEEIAEQMNLTFINIKVDREERPDIDNVYMEVCQMLTGSGGWPLTIIMTAEKKPFFAGTYFPPQSVHGRPGMVDLIARISDVWKNKRDLVETSANDITIKLSEQDAYDDDSGIKLNKTALKAAANTLSSKFDSRKGGFSSAPKFPIPHNLTFMLRYAKSIDSQEILNMVYTTLDQMRLGGIYDQIGYGFHRYSTDANWLLPHFEKMLYDQAGLIIAYAEAYQMSGNELYRRTVNETVEYIKRELRADEGGFYSAEDADSEGIEGKFYVWTLQELSDVLGDDATKFAEIFNIKESGNYFDEAGEYNRTKNIPHLLNTKFILNTDREFIEKCREKLFSHREQRIHPFKDDKILCDWTGLMIEALAKAGFIFSEQEYLNMACKAADFILDNMLIPGKNSLLHRYRQSDVAIAGMLDDYAFTVSGFIELYASTSIQKYLEWAIKLTDTALENFFDMEAGGFYQTSKHAELLFRHKKVLYDGALPSGNSIMLENLNKLYFITTNEQYLNAIERTQNYFSSKVMQYPAGYTKFLSSLMWSFMDSCELVVVGKQTDKNHSELLDVLRKSYNPRSVILYLNAQSDIEQLSPWTKDMKTEEGTTLVYLCRNHVCSLPTSEPEVLEHLLKQ